METSNAIAILDFGSQYTQLIARRVREAHVYCELFPWDASPKDVLEQVVVLKDRGLIGLEKIKGSSPVYNYLRNNL